MKEVFKDKYIIDSGVDILEAKYGRLSDECREEFKSFLKIVNFEKSEEVVSADQYSNKLYFIRSGSMRAYYIKDGKEVTDWFAFRHDFICAINSFFLKIPSPHYIESIEPTEAGVISQEDMNHLCKKYHEFEHLARMITTEVMLQLQQRIVGLQFENAQKKYQDLLLKNPEITQKVPLGHIASYLGITLETLSRIRAVKKRI